MERHYTVQEFCENYGYAPQTCYQWVWKTKKKGTLHGPRFLKINGRIRYPASAIEEFLERKRAETDAELQIGASS